MHNGKNIFQFLYLHHNTDHHQNHISHRSHPFQKKSLKFTNKSCPQTQRQKQNLHGRENNCYGATAADSVTYQRKLEATLAPVQNQQYLPHKSPLLQVFTLQYKNNINEFFSVRDLHAHFIFTDHAINPESSWHVGNLWATFHQVGILIMLSVLQLGLDFVLSYLVAW